MQVTVDSALAPLLAQLRLVARRRAQRVQSSSLPPQQVPAWHALDSQSPSRVQAWPGPHGVQAPPQSMSVSFWFRTRSSQLALAQEPSRQTPVSQSSARVQPLPAVQAVQLPPQSRPVSVPFCTPSWQEGWAQRRVVSAQKSELAQSALLSQLLPSVQRVAQGPAQSASASPWLRMPSLQLAGRQLPSRQLCDGQSRDELHSTSFAGGGGGSRGNSQAGSSEGLEQLAALPASG